MNYLLINLILLILTLIGFRIPTDWNDFKLIYKD